MKIALIGAGSIGIAWAVVFSRAGYEVALQDPDAGRRGAAPGEIATRFRDLAGAGLYEGNIDAALARVSVHADLAAAVADAGYVQENAPEVLDVKRSLFADLDRLTPAEAVLASSSSAITTSAIASDLPGRGRCLVMHPGNPPFLVPAVELVPAPFTAAAAVDRAEHLLRDCGMSPVRVMREIEGFVFNRLQGAMLREAYCLVRDGVISASDLDRIVRDGLGLRWSVVGPFETADLNVRGGLPAHAARMGEAYARMGAERGQHDPWTPDLVERVAAERRAALPFERWEERVRWRDSALATALAARQRWPAWPPEEPS